MKMSGRILSCCVALLIALTSVSAVQNLNSISDLKKINFGQSVPKRSLILLHWFANMVDINNNVIRLTYNPNGDYGSHYYGNFEGLLDPLPSGYRYYTVGNIDQETTRQLPGYVIHPPGEYVNENRGRIIIRVRGQIIDRVYMTQHFQHQGTPYDPNHTYQITTNLLRQIREFSLRDNQQPLLSLRERYGSNANDRQLRHLTDTWGNLACVGLLLLIVTEKKQPFTNIFLILVIFAIIFFYHLLVSMRRV